jgi:hypothetical protein
MEPYSNFQTMDPKRTWVSRSPSWIAETTSWVTKWHLEGRGLSTDIAKRNRYTDPFRLLPSVNVFWKGILGLI